MDTEYIEESEQQEEEQKELSPAEAYNLRQRKIAEEMNNPVPRIADKVWIDLDWTPECGREPNPTIEGRIVGVNMEMEYYVQYGKFGTRKYVPYEAVKLRYD